MTRLYVLPWLFCSMILARPHSLLAQGLLPPQKSQPAVSSGTPVSLLIGERVPETLHVTNREGSTRSLLSYKAPLEVLAVVFISARCNPPSALPEMGRLFQSYRGWRVSFVALNAGTESSEEELQTAMRREGLAFPLLRDENHAASQLLRAQTAPLLVIIDEIGYLRYRGPLGAPARAALEASIGHVDPVPNPEPAIANVCTP